MALLWEMSRGSRLLYAVSCAALFLTVSCNFLLPQLIRFFVDSVSGVPASAMPILSRIVALAGLRPGFARGGFFRAGVLVVVIAAFGGLCNFTYRRTLSLGAEGLIKRLRDELYSHIQYLPFAWHITIQTGDIIQRCTSDVDIVHNFVFRQMVDMFRTVVLVVFAYAILFRMDAVMAGASFAFIPVIFFYSFIFLMKAQ